MNRIIVIFAPILLVLLTCEKPSSLENDIQELEYLEGGYLEGYYLNTTAIEPEMPMFLEDTIGDFTFRIFRDHYHWSDRHHRLVEKAESLFPPSDSIMSLQNYNVDEIPANESLWWYSTFDGVRIPYAITWEAVEYYLTLLDYYEEGLFEEAGTIDVSRADFNYETTVTQYDSFQILNYSFGRVYVVTQLLEWDSYCGPLCALFLTARRSVIIDFETEQVLGVFGDGPCLVMVS